MAEPYGEGDATGPLLCSIASPRSPCKETRLNISNGTYEGELIFSQNASNGSNKIRSGRGTMTYFNGNKYTGEWVDDRFDGVGEYIWADGKKFTGNFKKDKIDGNGTGFWPDGRIYKGEYSNDLAHGTGLVTLPDGRAFEGIFENDYPVEGLMIECDGTAFFATFDSRTHVSEWRPRNKKLVGKFEVGWRKQEHSSSLREFSWSDGRFFAGYFKGMSPAMGVLTEADGKQFLTTYSGNTLLVHDPRPLIKILLKTKVCNFD